MIDTKRERIDTKGFELREALKLAINKREFLLDKPFREQQLPKEFFMFMLSSFPYIGAPKTHFTCQQKRRNS